MNNSRLFRLSRIVIALTAASGMMVNTAYATDEALNIPNRLIRITPNHYRLAIVKILTMPSVDLSPRCWMKVFCVMLTAKFTTARMITNLILMPLRRKP